MKARYAAQISGVVAVVAAGGFLAAGPAAADTHTYTHPTAGVTCDNWVRTSNSGYAYWGKCTGTPTGTSGGYKYRVRIQCVVGSNPVYEYSPWATSGWAHADNSCPDNDMARSHVVQFAFT